MRSALRTVLRQSYSQLVRLVRPTVCKPNGRLYWHRERAANFGDELGPYLYRRIAGVDAVYAEPSDTTLQTVYMSAGSMLERTRANCIVWGSGIIRSDALVRRPFRVVSVRGPRTHLRLSQLGIGCPSIYGDPGLLLPMLYQPDVDCGSALGVVPHYVDLASVSDLFSSTSDVRIIDVRAPVEDVVRAILQCEILLSSSLHGCVVAHAYGRPVAWTEFGGRLAGDGVKFHDHYESLGVQVKGPLHLRASASMTQLRDMILEYPQPAPVDVAKRAAEVHRVCPFPRKEDHAIGLPASTWHP